MLILRSPRLLLIVTIPLLLSTGLYVLFFYYGASHSERLIATWMDQLTRALPDWGWLLLISRWFLRILAWLTLALVAALSFTIVSGLILAPFNDYLCRAALKLRTLQTGRADLLPQQSLPMGQVIRLELKRTIILIVGSLMAAVLAIIPFMQIPALVIGAFLVAFEYFGYPLSQHTSRLVPVALFAMRYPAVSLGFGSFLLLIMALPFTAIFYIPLAVVAGSTLYADHAITQKKLV